MLTQRSCPVYVGLFRSRQRLSTAALSLDLWDKRVERALVRGVPGTFDVKGLLISYEVFTFLHL